MKLEIVCSTGAKGGEYGIGAKYNWKCNTVDRLGLEL